MSHLMRVSGCGEWTCTIDLKVMGLASWLLLYPAMLGGDLINLVGSDRVPMSTECCTTYTAVRLDGAVAPRPPFPSGRCPGRLEILTHEHYTSTAFSC